MALRRSQLSFSDLPLPKSKAQVFQSSDKHGSDLRKGLRKIARPINTKKSLHLTFRAERARGKWSLRNPQHRFKIDKMVRDLARKNQIQIFQYANAGNHLHLLVRARDRDKFKKFTRTAAGLIARLVTGAKKGKPIGRFWDSTFFSRVIEWGKAFQTAKDYVIQNKLEAEGFIPYQMRGKKLRP